MRVAVIADPEPEYALPAIALARRLRAAGDEVLVLTGKRWLSRLDELHIDAEEMPQLPDASAEDTEPEPQPPAAQPALAPALAGSLRAWNPDLLVADVASPAGGMAAELLAIPWAQLHPRPLYLSGRADDQHGAHRRSRHEGLPAQVEARASIGLPPRDRGPQVRLVATLPALEPTRRDWPSDASVVGPLLWDPAESELAIPSGVAPVVLVASSASGGGASELLDAALKGLQEVRLVAPVAEVAEAPDSGDREVPEWASVGPGRQATLLARARVVVSDGEHGTVAAALAAGVPLVLVPHSSEQWELARRAERLGAAIVLRRLSPRRLSRAVDRILDQPSYAAAAAEIVRGAATADPVMLCHLAAHATPSRLPASRPPVPAALSADPLQH